MPLSNIDVARRGFEALNSGDLEAMMGLIADDILAEVPTGFANASTYRGRDAFRRMLDQWLDPWSAFQAEPLDYVEVGPESVVVNVHQRGTGRESGIEVDMTLAYLMRVRDGLLVGWRLCADADEALALARDDLPSPP